MQWLLLDLQKKYLQLPVQNIYSIYDQIIHDGRMKIFKRSYKQSDIMCARGGNELQDHNLKQLTSKLVPIIVTELTIKH